MTLALSIRQPWPWAILHARKDIENRSWSTRVRGRILIHAGKAMTKAEYEDFSEFFDDISGLTQSAPPFNSDEFRRGGIVGEVEIVDCVKQSLSPWFMGEYGFVLQNRKPLPFRACKGALGFFEVDEGALYNGA